MNYMKNGKAEDLQQAFNAIQEDYPKEAFYALMNLMGSHYTPRALFLLGGGTDSFERAKLDPTYNEELGKTRLKLASIMQMGYPGAPTIYYGDEAGVTGSKDPDDRRTYPWGNEDQDLLNHYKKIGAVRVADQELFSHGDVNHVYASGDVFAFTRTNNEKAALIITNRGTAEKTVTINVKDIIQNGVTLTDQLASSYNVTTTNNEVSMTVPGQSGRMLVNPTALPSALTSVTDLEVEEGSKSVTLSWSGDAENYKVNQTNIKGALYKEVKVTSENSLTIDNLTNGRTYYFAIASVDKNGNESKLSETNAAIPHYDLASASISNVSELQDNILDLSANYSMTAVITIEGATDTELAEGVKAKLLVKKDTDATWKESDATYLTQDGAANLFQAAFKPLETRNRNLQL
ncbi:alpha-amylase family glycosyl hydrolase [Bacillus sp. DJP31]|uniref:fibronectin type III domain-containing protein n=1 Tax=Bacillus sp. DJP31 TaxID=3409789 RepID=UPI003BB4A23A